MVDQKQVNTVIETESYPSGTKCRLASISMALTGARILANDAISGTDEGCGVLGTLDLAIAELANIDELQDSFST